MFDWKAQALVKMFLTLCVACFMLGFGAATFWTSCSTDPKHGTKTCSQLITILVNPLDKKFLPLSAAYQQTPAEGQENDRRNSRLMTKAEVESTFEESSWQRLAYEDFKSTILARGHGQKTFPCIYATKGYREDGHRYVFLKSSNPSTPQNVRLIGAALSHYLKIAKYLGSNTSLVIIASPPDVDLDFHQPSTEKTVDDYNSEFWNLLRGLRISDPASWPSFVPSSTSSAEWTFCYAGEAVFPVLLTPAHSHRFSRHSSVPIIALQPKWILDELLSTPEKRHMATRKVRKLLREYDNVDVSPDLTSYGEEGSQEVRQLCLKDVNESVRCPYDDFDT